MSVVTEVADPTQTELDPAAEALDESPDVDNLPALLSRGTDVSATLDERIRVAQLLSEAGMLPEQYRNRPGNVLAAQYAADALNIPLFTAFQHLHIVKGKVGMSAELMRSLMRRAGIRYRMDANDDRAIMTLKMPDETEWSPAVTFTINAAIHAGLCRRDSKTKAIVSRSASGEVKPWEAHTEAMLVARVTSKTARMLCPEVLQGMSYTEDELQEAARVDARPTVVQVTTATPTADTEAATPRPELPATPRAAMVLLARLTKVDDMRDLFRHASRNSWLDEEFGGFPFRSHLVNAQEGLKGKKPTAYGTPGQCTDTVTHTEHVWFDDDVRICDGVEDGEEVLDGEIVDETEPGEYPDVDVPESNFGDPA